ncbi:MAG: DNA-directed RNA polymerase subunit omega [Candidatus Acidiferrales bacterium]
MAVSRQAPESQFAYVVVAARRARQLMMGGRPMVDNPQAHKTTRIAEEELQKGLLEYETKDAVDGSEDKDKDGKRRK